MNYLSLFQQVTDKVLVDNGCWEWTGAKQGDGYGCFKRSGRGLLAHRAMYELFIGPIPEDLVLDHTCRNRGCVRPDHLEPVTQRMNVQRGDSPERQRQIPLSRRKPNGQYGPAL